MEAWDSSESFSASESVRDLLRRSWPLDTNRVSKSSPSGGVFASVPRYIINLDHPPEERWNQVIQDYKSTTTPYQDLALASTLLPLHQILQIF